jgi:hypothetical protein
VPPEGDPLPPPLPPPPHETRNVTNRRDDIAAVLRAKLQDLRLTGSHTIPISAVAQNQVNDQPLRCNVALLGAVVDTLTVNVEADVALTLSLPGTVHVAFAGAPVQVKLAVPLIPPPPMASVYFAVEPAETVAEFELPEGTPNPRPGGTPVPFTGAA